MPGRSSAPARSFFRKTLLAILFPKFHWPASRCRLLPGVAFDRKRGHRKNVATSFCYWRRVQTFPSGLSAHRHLVPSPRRTFELLFVVTFDRRGGSVARKLRFRSSGFRPLRLPSPKVPRRAARSSSSLRDRASTMGCRRRCGFRSVIRCSFLPAKFWIRAVGERCGIRHELPAVCRGPRTCAVEKDRSANQ